MAKTVKAATPSRLAFGRRLREERLRRKMTLEDVAEVSGMTWSYISHIERGRRNIGVDNMHALAQAVELPLWEMLKDEPESEA